jgi:undecaprenyl-diphosphatase
MDADLTRWINSFAGANAVLDGTMIAITQYGVPLTVVLVVLQWWSGINRTHVRHATICAGLSFLAGLAVNQIILLFVHRIRPFDAGVSHLLIARSADWSFPSDHATAMAAVVASFGIQRLHGRASAFGVLALLVCFSRVFVGTHYVADILGGVTVGFLAAHGVALAYREGTRLDLFLTGIL